MSAKPIQIEITNHEVSVGHPKICHECRKEFLAHEDGCPSCGASALISTLIPTVELKDCKDSSLFRVIFTPPTGISIINKK